MSATKQRPAAFPTVAELEATMKDVSRAYDGVEATCWEVSRIVEAFHEGEVLATPTLETVGALAEYVDLLGVYVDQLAKERDRARGLLRDVMMMRAEVAFQDQLAAEAVAS